MAPKKAGTKGASKSAKKNAAKAPDAQSERDKALAERADDTPIGGNVLGNEPLGPGVEHEDHEGGETDSLARRGVRGPITRFEDKTDEEKAAVTGAPSVRERQTAPFANQGGARRGATRLDAVGVVEKKAADKKENKVVVIATRTGFYPADGRVRRRGDVFEYTMGEKETKLPSWMIDRDGKLESRASDETSSTYDDSPAAVIEVSKTGQVTQR